MTWTPREGLCEVCGRPDDKGNPFCGEEFYPGVYFHLRCLNSLGAIAWRAARRADNPVYDRYSRQMSVREPINCPSCGKAMARIPKGIGMGASDWAAHCLNCHRTGARQVSVHHDGQTWQEISKLRY